MGRHVSHCRIVFAALLLTATACAFDRSGLGECRSDSECGEGRCVDRVCVTNLPGDTGGDRADGLPDLDEDVPLDGGEDLDLGDDAPDVVADADGGDGGDVPPDIEDDGPPCPPEPLCEEGEAVFCDGLGNLQRIDCATAEACEDADAGCRCEDGACVPRVCLPDAVDCVLDQIVQCDADGADFTVLDTCGVLEVCFGGECADSECEPDTTFCVGDVIVTCSSEGEPSVAEDCRLEDGYCDEDGPTCEDRNCMPDERRCAVDPENGDDLVEQCDPRGIGFELLDTCLPTQTCSNGACEGPICTPDEPADCIGTGARAVCNATGSGYDNVPCGEGFYCDDGGGAAVCLEGVCTPDASHCIGPGEQFETCNEAGSGYLPAVACESDQYCDGGECLAQVCTPGDAVCDDDFTLRSCDERGAAEVVEDCPDDTYCEPTSVPPACEDQICVPDQALCDEGGNAVMCNSTGSATSPLETCDYTCFMGECLDPFCGDGITTGDLDEECDDRNDLTCDGCEDCLELFSLGFSPTSDSVTSRPQWAPLQSLFTIEAWVLVTGDGQLVGIGESGSDNGRLFITAGGQPAFFMNLGNGQTIQVTGTASLIDGDWHHLAGQRTDIDDVNLYVDGQSVDSEIGALTSVSLDDGDLWIGAETVFTPGTARIDEVRISDVVRYATAFTPARTLASDGDTMALYHLDAGTGVTATDASGNDRHITMVNVTWHPDDCYGGAVTP